MSNPPSYYTGKLTERGAQAVCLSAAKLQSPSNKRSREFTRHGYFECCFMVSEYSLYARIHLLPHLNPYTGSSAGQGLVLGLYLWSMLATPVLLVITASPRGCGHPTWKERDKKETACACLPVKQYRATRCVSDKCHHWVRSLGIWNPRFRTQGLLSAPQ